VDGLTVGLLTNERDRAALQRLFEQVAVERGWEPGDDLSTAASSTYVALFRGGTLTGGAEVRRPGATGELPMHATWPELRQLVTGPSAELVLLALSPEHRGTLRLLRTLSGGIWRECHAMGLTSLIAAVPVPRLAAYRRFGWGVTVVSEARAHWSEACLPCVIDLEEVVKEGLRRIRSAPSLAYMAEEAFRYE
jgi:hypothetical protein